MKINKETIDEVVKLQKLYFESGLTKSIKFRKEMLNKLYSLIKLNEEKILEALKLDLGKSYKESYLTEISLCYSEIKYMIKNLNKLTKKKKVKNCLATFPSKSYIKREPIGLTYIISPFNYPFQLAIIPLIDSIAAGNVNILRCSEKSSYVSNVIKDMINTNFEPNYLIVLSLNYEESDYLIEQDLDHIFFTGSEKIGKTILEKSSKYLTKVSLELGGKSPCLIFSDCNIKDTVKKVIFGKFLNVGQTCIAIDHILIKNDFLNRFLDELRLQLNEIYNDALNNEFYGKIIDDKAFNRLVSYLNDGQILLGGNFDKDKLKIEPTVITNINEDSNLNNDEIFGPILPIYTFEDEKDFVKHPSLNNNPLAFYIFTKNIKKANEILDKYHFGGACINDTIMHITNHNLPFGGFKNSGLNQYHGKFGFDTFSHIKPILKGGKLQLKLRFPPYDDDLKLIKKLLK